jgi:dihydrofolate synthase/folylpolyglutamate synthase
MLQLGNTLPAIAGEKAGIIKPHIPVISGVTASEARQTIARIAVARQAPCFEIERHFRCRYRPGTRYQPGSDGTLHAPPTAAAEIRPPSLDYEVADSPAWRTVYDGVELGMWGEHQARNAAVAIATVQRLPGVRLTEPALRRALRRVRCPARIEVIGRRPTMILDAAHNVASMEALVQVVAETFAGCRPIVLLATTSGKDIEGMLRVLLPAVQRLVCTQYVTNPRALAASQLYQVASAVRAELGLEVGIERRTDLPEALRLAQETAQADDIIIVTGSFFVAGEVATLLQAAVDR